MNTVGSSSSFGLGSTSRWRASVCGRVLPGISSFGIRLESAAVYLQQSLAVVDIVSVRMSKDLGSCWDQLEAYSAWISLLGFLRSRVGAYCLSC